MKTLEISLKNWRTKVSVNYVLRIVLIAVVLTITKLKLFEKSKLTLPLCFHILPLFEDSKIDLEVVDDITLSDTPPWSQS